VIKWGQRIGTKISLPVDMTFSLSHQYAVVRTNHITEAEGKRENHHHFAVDE
jgi:hypothetical protein